MDESDSDELLENSWSLSKRNKIPLNSHEESAKHFFFDFEKDKLTKQTKKFEELKVKSSDIMLRSSIRRQKTEVRRSQKLMKKALKDPWIKAAVEGGETSHSKEIDSGKEKELESMKSFLFVNKHLQGPIPHGDCGPKTELEHQIEDCIKKGDLEKAELLSDTLTSRQFAVEIANAFAAKKYKEKQEELKSLERSKKRKKLRWMFEAKEKWQMKGNM